MKLRYDSSSIRIRLTLEELALLQDAKEVRAEFPFAPGDVLIWTLQKTPDLLPSLERSALYIKLSIPDFVIRSLASQNSSVAKKQDLTIELDVAGLSISLEVDFFQVKSKVKN